MLGGIERSPESVELLTARIATAQTEAKSYAEVGGRGNDTI